MVWCKQTEFIDRNLSHRDILLILLRPECPHSWTPQCVGVVLPFTTVDKGSWNNTSGALAAWGGRWTEFWLKLHWNNVHHRIFSSQRHVSTKLCWKLRGISESTGCSQTHFQTWCSQEWSKTCQCKSRGWDYSFKMNLKISPFLSTWSC